MPHAPTVTVDFEDLITQDQDMSRMLANASQERETLTHTRLDRSPSPVFPDNKVHDLFCHDCGAIFNIPEQAILHATRSGHQFRQQAASARISDLIAEIKMLEGENLKMEGADARLDEENTRLEGENTRLVRDNTRLKMMLRQFGFAHEQIDGFRGRDEVVMEDQSPEMREHLEKMKAEGYGVGFVSAGMGPDY